MFHVQFLYEECHIDEACNETWYEKYKFEIPVIHLDGSYLMKHRVNERLLKKALNISEQA